ncbi:hypothetical protein [Saccharothrix syringae]|uniref:DUF732 domain-containing protein n=1 Tax=Saccharothrix syringae TaxID=103733 RepID=A0A5Q0H262_SACSY|nr:hypothetical protein [Saccharothrix syringae]QFZ20337.1 hypothetical protein EKG83_25550 [Saccharothrix syringae]
MTGTTPSGLSAAEMSSIAAAAGIPPKPDRATAEAYLAELRAIEPLLVDEDNTDKAIDRGRNQCSAIPNHAGDQAKLVELTNTRFTAPGHASGFGPEVAEQVLAVVRKHLCPTY